jgi:hypothetical protein
MTEYEEMKNQLVELRKKMSSVAKSTMEAGAKELFAKYPELTSFGWKQYTPSFNDGDPCRFTCCARWPYINGLNPDYSYKCEDDEELDDDEEKLAKVKTQNFDEILKAVTAHLSQFEEEDLETMYGDSVKIIVTREGVETEYYDCGH